MDAAFDSFLSLVLRNRTEARNSADWLKHRDHVLVAFCVDGELEPVQWILNEGANPTYYQNAPLWNACENGHTEIVKLLLTHTSVVENAHKHNNRCLFAAQRREYDDIEKILLAIPAVAEGPSMRKWGYGLLD